MVFVALRNSINFRRYGYFCARFFRIDLTGERHTNTQEHVGRPPRQSARVCMSVHIGWQVAADRTECMKCFSVMVVRLHMRLRLCCVHKHDVHARAFQTYVVYVVYHS